MLKLESKDSKTFSLAKVTIKIVKLANIEDTDEYLNINEVTIQVNINKKLSSIERANNIPKYVATPFPPLNFNHAGNMCPRKVIKAEI